MKQYAASILLLLVPATVFAQAGFHPDTAYIRQSTCVHKLYKANNFILSAKKYDTLFFTFEGNGTIYDKYNAACSWALAGNTEKAFSYLKQVVIIDKWTNLPRLITEPGLETLHQDDRWLSLIDSVKSNRKKAEKILYRPVAIRLNSIYDNDRKNRQQIDSVRKKFGIASKQMDSLQQRIDRHDSINMIQVKNILRTYGWLGPDEVGERGATAILLVIQQADSLTQATCLPKMQAAVKAGKVRSQDFELLKDRILVNAGKK